MGDPTSLLERAALLRHLGGGQVREAGRDERNHEGQCHHRGDAIPTAHVAILADIECAVAMKRDPLGRRQRR
jgi:hypothetical protein